MRAECEAEAAATASPETTKSRCRTSANASAAPANATIAATSRMSLSPERYAFAISCDAPGTARPTAICPLAAAFANGAATVPARSDRIRLSRIAPSTAIPVAIPTWRKVLLIPDAIPAFCGGTTLTAVEASGGFTSPIPIPPTMNPGSSVVQLELGVIPWMRRSASPTTAIPPPSRNRTGIRTDSRPATGETKNASSESGRKRTPASIGE